MEKFLRVTGPAAPLPTANIDTDVIMPKIFLKGIDRAGLSQGVFHDLRFDGNGVARPGFILNQPAMQGCRFLITGPNFGCGSSREHAVWGLLQYGIRAVIGTSFAGIFADNAANNGLLLVSLDDADLARLMAEVGPEGGVIEVDLEDCVILSRRAAGRFPDRPASPPCADGRAGPDWRDAETCRGDPQLRSRIPDGKPVADTRGDAMTRFWATPISCPVLPGAISTWAASASIPRPPGRARHC